MVVSSIKNCWNITYLVLAFELCVTVIHGYSNGWLITSPPLRPIVRVMIGQSPADDLLATITKELRPTDVITETPFDAALSVHSGNFLTLGCLAPYPVMWWKKNEKTPIPAQTRTYNRLVQPWTPEWNKSRSPVDDNNILPAIEYYVSLIGIYTANQETRITFECKPEMFPGYAVSLNLLVANTPAFSESPIILQAGFDKIAVINWMKSASSKWHFLYYIPPFVKDHKAYLVLSNGTELYPVTGPELYPGTGTSGYGFSIYTFQLDQNLHKCTIHPSKTVPLGRYSLVIEASSANATLRESHAFTLDANSKLNIGKNSIKQLNSDRYDADLLTGQVYQLIFYSNDRLFVGKGDFVVYAQLSLDEHCIYREVNASKMAEECGIIASSQFNDGDSLRGIALVLNATSRCTLLSRIEVAVLCDNTDPLCGVRGPSTRLEQSYLHMIPIEEENNGKPIIHFLNATKSGNAFLSNGTLTLRCMVPLCSINTISWCRLNDQTRNVIWQNKGPSYSGIISDDPLIEISMTALWQNNNYSGTISDDHAIEFSFFQLNNNTVAYDLTFSVLSVNHSGQYMCVSENPEAESENIASYFNLTVKNPSSPRIKNRNSEIVDVMLSEKNGRAILKCEADGFPAPKILWFRHEDADLTELETNSELLSVDKLGHYECRAVSEVGNDRQQFRVRMYDGISTKWIAIAASIVAITLLAIFALYFWIKRRAKIQLFETILTLFEESASPVPLDPNIPLNDQADKLSYESKFEVRQDFLTVNEEIGRGYFGKVFKGKLKANIDDDGVLVAAKSPRDPTNYRHNKDLMDEFKLMAKIGLHVNVLSVLGICKIERNSQIFIFVLTEFCAYGSLRLHLEKYWSVFGGMAIDSHCCGWEESSVTLLEYAYQAVNGMRHLAAQKIIHRDLALRNLLLTDKHIIKISDFGMSRLHDKTYMERLHKRGSVPFRWMAPESFIKGEYNQKSDVWSFGVVLWEMFTCSIPYDKEKISTIQSLLSWLAAGHRLEKPDIAPEEIYALMLECWQQDPKSRPSFNQCKRRLGQILEDASPVKYIVVKEELNKQWSPPSKEVRNTPNPRICALVDVSPSSTRECSGESGDGSGPSRISDNQSKTSSCSNGPISFFSGKSNSIDLAHDESDSSEISLETFDNAHELSSSCTADTKVSGN